jgi:hypothetical protein
MPALVFERTRDYMIFLVHFSATIVEVLLASGLQGAYSNL